MKTSKRMVLVVIAGIVLAGGSAWAGSLTPPGAPNSTMHTLEDIFQRIGDLEAQLDTIKLRQGAAGFADTVGGMVLIQEGPFQMGDSFAEGAAVELPVHTVNVGAFYMDQYPVTKSLWDAVYTYATANGFSFDNTGLGKGPSHTVHTVNWYDCVKWANARSERDGLTPVYYTTAVFKTVYKTGTDTPHANWAANGYRLPTEAEWEKAARGSVNGRRFPWADGNTISHTRANYYATPSTRDYDVSATSGYHPDWDDGAPLRTSPVGSFAPNGYGLYDMAGNVWEWCWDWYGDTYYAISPASDPGGPASGSNRVLRGGSWGADASDARVAVRGNSNPGFEDFDFGFRCVRGL